MILILLFVCKSSKFYSIGNVYFYEFDCKGSDLLWFMQMKERKSLIFLLNLGDCVENAIVCNAHHDGHFAFAGDDANIYRVGNQRQVFAAFFASKQSQVAEEATSSGNTAGLNAVWIVLNLHDFIGRDIDFPSEEVDVNLLCCYRYFAWDDDHRSTDDYDEHYEGEQ